VPEACTSHILIAHMGPRGAFQSWLRGEGRKHQSSSMLDSGLDDTGVPATEGDITLADLRADERARVLGLSCSRLATNRLISLGFTPGAEVDMTQNYGHGPIIVTIRGGSVALGRGEARHIHVERSLE